MAFTLPPLPYAHEALEPHIDTQTMQKEKERRLRTQTEVNRIHLKAVHIS